MEKNTKDVDTSTLQKLTDFSLMVSSITQKNDCFIMISQKIRELTNSICTTIGTFDRSKKVLKVRNIDVSDFNSKIIRGLLNKSIVGMKIPVSDEIYNKISNERIAEPENIHDATFGDINPIMGKIIESTFNVGWIIGMGLFDGNDLLGTMLIIGNKSTPKPDMELLDSFARITSSTLKRFYKDHQILNQNDNVGLDIEDFPDIIWNSNLKFEFTYISDTVKDILGFESNDLIGVNIKNFLFNNQNKNTNDLFRLFDEAIISDSIEENSFLIESEVISNNNSKIYLETNVKITKDVNSNIKNICGISRDITSRKQIEFEIAESEARFRQFYDNAPVAYESLDSNLNILEVNHAWLELLGYESHEVIGKNIFEFLVLDDISKINNHYHNLFTNKILKNIDLKYIHKNKSTIDVLLNSKAYNDHSGKFLKTHSIWHNISDLKKTQEKLKESEKRFSLFMNHLPAGAFMKDSNGTTIYANQYLIDNFNAHEWINKNTFDVFPYEFAKVMVDNDKLAIEKGFLKYLETIPHIDNSFHTYETVKFRIQRDNDTPLLGGFSTDKTKEIKFQNELKLTEEKLRLALEGSKDGAFDWNLEDNTVDWNFQAYNILGYTNLEFLVNKEKFYDLIHLDDLNNLKNEINLDLENKDFHINFECRMKHKNGSWLWVAIQGKAFEFMENGKIKRISGTIRNISHFKLIEEKLIETEQRLQSIIENIDYGILIQTNNKILFCNTELLNLFGLSSFDNICKNVLSDYIYEEDRNIISELHNKLFIQNDKQNSKMLILRILKSDGTIIKVETSSKLIDYNNHKCIFIMLKKLL